MSQLALIALTEPDVESEHRVMDAPSTRVCACGKVFVIGKTKRTTCAPCTEGRRVRYSSKVSGRPSRSNDTIKDLAMAVVEITRAHSEFCAIAASGETGHRREAMEMEPLARINLVRGLTADVLRRHGQKAIQRDQAEDETSDST